ncbi:MAG: hypothetical protein A2W65_00470 [Candidatus Taylorbacteria bacterium RIFCSPLOWO2_02_50_13]|nr:MAG: hypothetical protein A2W65_00470 [Candidatus Taylorbacteria bacterium RIFCSPLOWO2_02_50_13]
MAKQFFSILLITLMLLAGTAMFMPEGIVSAGHPCTGDAAADAVNDGTEGHSCLPGDIDTGDKKVTTFTGLLGRLNSLINALIPFIVGLAVFVIIWGIFVYVAQAGDEEKRVQARKFIVWGVIGVFFMLSVWGLVNILVNSINLEKTINTSDIPRVPGIGGTDGTDGRPNGMNDGTDLSGVCTNGLDSFNNPC